MLAQIQIQIVKKCKTKPVYFEHLTFGCISTHNCSSANRESGRDVYYIISFTSFHLQVLKLSVLSGVCVCVSLLIALNIVLVFCVLAAGCVQDSAVFFLNCVFVLFSPLFFSLSVFSSSFLLPDSSSLAAPQGILPLLFSFLQFYSVMALNPNTRVVSTTLFQ